MMQRWITILQLHGRILKAQLHPGAMQASAEEIEEGLKMMRNPLEYPILMDINHDRSKEGLSPIVKLTVPVLKTHLRGKSINGSEWKMGSKKREDLIEDYRSASSLPSLKSSQAALFIIPAFLNQRKQFSIIP